MEISASNVQKHQGVKESKENESKL